jgi:hypothetical protein
MQMMKMLQLRCTYGRCYLLKMGQSRENEHAKDEWRNKIQTVREIKSENMKSRYMKPQGVCNCAYSNAVSGGKALLDDRRETGDRRCPGRRV